MRILNHSVFRVFAAAGVSLLLLPVIACAELPTADDFKVGPDVEQAKTVSEAPVEPSGEPRTSIEVPPASELLDYLRKLPKPKRQLVIKEKEPETEAEKLRVLYGIPLGGVASQCDRAIPTRPEFLRMVKRNPADARQIMQSCNLNLRGISPLRQLPVGNRQLPVDTRQRPVGTWQR